MTYVLYNVSISKLKKNNFIDYMIHNKTFDDQCQYHCLIFTQVDFSYKLFDVCVCVLEMQEKKNPGSLYIT